MCSYLNNTVYPFSEFWNLCVDSRVISFSTAQPPTDHPDEMPGVHALTYQWSTAVALQCTSTGSAHLSHIGIKQSTSPNPSLELPSITWHASTLPSLYPAHSILGVKAPLYIQLLLHRSVLIRGTDASFNIFSVSSERSKALMSYTPASSAVNVPLFPRTSHSQASALAWPQPDIQHFLPGIICGLYLGRQIALTVSGK